MTDEWTIANNERALLRELAKKQAEYAALPVMDERRHMWFGLNDGRPGARPPFIIETWTFGDEFLPETTLRCTSPAGREIERQLLGNIRNHELIDDDKVMPDSFDIGWFVDIDEFGVKVGFENAADGEGRRLGFKFEHPIKDLERDFALLKPAECRVDREKTLRWKAFVEELLGDILPVQIRGGIFGHGMLTHRLVYLMGMEAFFVAMYECPEALHRYMAFLRDNALRIMRWGEAEGLMTLNNGNQTSFGSSFNFTTRLPAPGYAGRPRLRDMWGCANSQETVGVSPELFHEFCFSYYRDVCAPMGLVYYGCCEPTHPFWEDLRRLPNLKKVSISKWCDQRFMGEALQDTGVVFSRKPDPNLLGVDVQLDEEGWAAHIRETLEATPGIPVEFIVRDVYTVHHNLEKCKRAVNIARREIRRRWEE